MGDASVIVARSPGPPNEGSEAARAPRAGVSAAGGGAAEEPPSHPGIGYGKPVKKCVGEEGSRLMNAESIERAGNFPLVLLAPFGFIY